MINLHSMCWTMCVTDHGSTTIHLTPIKNTKITLVLWCLDHNILQNIFFFPQKKVYSHKNSYQLTQKTWYADSQWGSHNQIILNQWICFWQRKREKQTKSRSRIKGEMCNCKNGRATCSPTCLCVGFPSNAVWKCVWRLFYCIFSALLFHAGIDSDAERVKETVCVHVVVSVSTLPSHGCIWNNV